MDSFQHFQLYEDIPAHLLTLHTVYDFEVVVQEFCLSYHCLPPDFDPLVVPSSIQL